MNIDRTVLLQFEDKDHGVVFRVERWFIAGDQRIESMTRAALVWDSGKKDNEQVVLLGTSAARAVIEELIPFAS